MNVVNVCAVSAVVRRKRVEVNPDFVILTIDLTQ